MKRKRNRIEDTHDAGNNESSQKAAKSSNSNLNNRSESVDNGESSTNKNSNDSDNKNRNAGVNNSDSDDLNLQQTVPVQSQDDSLQKVDGIILEQKQDVQLETLGEQQREGDTGQQKKADDFVPATGTSEKQEQKTSLSAASASSREELNRDLTCTICWDYLEGAVQVLCGHTFCRACIIHWSKRAFHRNNWRRVRNPRQIQCPLCKKEFPYDEYALTELPETDAVVRDVKRERDDSL